jgi:transcription initiation factor TFIIA large subunit
MSKRGLITSNSLLSNVYHLVIEDVINNIQEEFESESVDEQVLLDLRLMWQLKLHQSHVMGHSLFGSTDEGSRSGPYSYESLYDYPHDQQSFYSYANLDQRDSLTSGDASALGTANNFYSKGSLQNRYPTYLPQTDGADDFPLTRHLPQGESFIPSEEKRPDCSLLQVDGLSENLISDKERASRTQSNADLSKEEDGELNSDLDSENGEEPDTEDVILCQYDKVHHDFV